MKKIVSLFLISIFLIGCQDHEKNLETEKFVDDRPLYESNAKPRKLEVRQYGESEKTGLVPSQIVYYCWGKELTDCPSQLNPLYEEKFIDYAAYPAEIGVPVNIFFDTFLSNTLPYPDHGELYIFHNNTYTPVEIVNKEFQVPNIEDVYTYVYKTIYDSDVKGIAFYVFKLNVKENWE